MGSGGPGPAAMLDALPWPNVVGKRCLAVGRWPEEVQRALNDRRAAEVVVDPGDGLEALARDPFDLTVAWGVATDADAPLDRLGQTWRATRNMLVSIEPIDGLLTVGARPLPLLRLGPGGDGPRWTMNGRAHHRLLTTAGFIVERPSRIVGVGGTQPLAGPGAIERLLGRALARGEGGTPHRALVARVRP